MQFDFLVLTDAGFVTAMAHGDIAIIAAKNHLGAFCNDMTITDTSIDGGFGATIAHGFDFFNAIGQLHQTHRAGVHVLNNTTLINVG